MNLFYTPDYAKTGDVIPFYNERTHRFEHYYLKNWNPDAPKDLVVHGWHQIITEDNRTYVETPTNICGGTGCVIFVDGKYHMYYCTFDFNPQAQWVRHAVSDDLVQWEDFPEEKFTADDDIYCLSDWRDPFVFWNEEEQKWWMLLAAREKSTTKRNGCVALCVSDDMKHWEYRNPLYAPKLHPGAYECPDLFKMGEWYYLVYSSYVDGFSTYYRMSRSLQGPWIRPRMDTFDGRAFYAAKTGFDGKDRFIYGWNPTKGENNWGFDSANDFGLDYKTWNWGGSIIVHKLVQHEDGTLGVCPVDSVANAFEHCENINVKSCSGEWQTENGSAFCDSPYSYSAAIGPKIPEQCCMKMTMRYSGNPTRFGLALQIDENVDFGYYLMFEPDHNRIQFRSGLRMYEQGGQMFPYAVEMERPIPLEEGKEYEIELYIQGSIGLLYINRDIAFGFRMFNYQDRQMGYFVSDGTVEIKNAQLCTE